jgi:hypothetical protein
MKGSQGVTRGHNLQALVTNRRRSNTKNWIHKNYSQFECAKIYETKCTCFIHSFNLHKWLIKLVDSEIKQIYNITTMPAREKKKSKIWT